MLWLVELRYLTVEEPVLTLDMLQIPATLPGGLVSGLAQLSGTDQVGLR